MSFWSAIVAIVAIIAFANMRTARYQAGRAPAERHDGESIHPALEREVIELRKRVEVLERILTDGRDASRLAQDIEALREH